MSTTSTNTDRKNPCKTWPECQDLYGPQSTVIPRVVPSGSVSFEPSGPRGEHAYAPPVAPVARVASASPVAPAPVAPKAVKVVATVSLYERIGKIEKTLEAINNDLAKGALAQSAELAAARAEVQGLKDAAARVKALPKMEPLPKEGDQVWLKSSGKGPFLLVAKTTFDMEVERETRKPAKGEKPSPVALKSRFGVEGFVARRIGDGKPVVLPAFDVSTTKPVFPTVMGRLVKYSFVALGLSTLLTATLAFGRIALDRAVHGPENVAPVKTSSNH